jgi:hypothetical protein
MMVRTLHVCIGSLGSSEPYFRSRFVIVQLEKHLMSAQLEGTDVVLSMRVVAVVEVGIRSHLEHRR